MLKFIHIMLFCLNVFSSSTFSSESKEELPNSLYSFSYGKSQNHLETIYVTTKSTLKTKDHQKLPLFTDQEEDFFNLYTEVRSKKSSISNLTLAQLKFFYHDGKSLKTFFWSIFYKNPSSSSEEEMKEPSLKKRKISEEKCDAPCENKLEEDVYRNFSLRAYSDLESLKKDHQDFSLVFFLSEKLLTNAEKHPLIEELDEFVVNDVKCKIVRTIPEEDLKKSIFYPKSVHAEKQFFNLFEKLINKIEPQQSELWPSGLLYKDKKKSVDSMESFYASFASKVNGCILNLYNTYDICSSCRSQYHENVGSPSIKENERFKEKEESPRGKFSRRIKDFLDHNLYIKTPNQLEVFLFSIAINFYDHSEYYLEEEKFKILNNKVYNQHIPKRYVPFEGEIFFSSYDVVPVFSYIKNSKLMTPEDFAPIESKFSKYLKSPSIDYKEPYEIKWHPEKLNDRNLGELDEKDIAVLGTLLYENRGHLSDLNLSKNGLGKNDDKSFRILCPSLMSLSNLTFLDLSSNTLKSSSYRPLSDALGKLIKLKKLNLNTMNCEDSLHNNFWILLSASLKNLRLLESIQVKENDIIYEGFKQIMKGLKGIKSLKTIDFEDNYITKILKENSIEFHDYENQGMNARTTHHFDIDDINPVLFTCVTYNFINNLPKECKFYITEMSLDKEYQELLKQLDDIKSKFIIC